MMQCKRLFLMVTTALSILGISLFFGSYFIGFSLELDRVQDAPSTLKAGSGAVHAIQFQAASEVATGTISFDFQNVIASTAGVSAEDVRLMYGPSGFEVEYLVQAAAGNQIWGATVNAEQSQVTLSYPSSSGTPISSGDRVLVYVGTDSSARFPVSASTSTIAVNVNQPQIQQAQQQAQYTLEAVGEPVQESQPISQSQQVSADFSRVQQYIQEQLTRVRNLVTQRESEQSRIAADQRPVGQVIAPPVASSTAIEAQVIVRESATSSLSAKENEIVSRIIYLAREKSIDIDPSRSTTISLKRNDGARLEIAIPQQAVDMAYRSEARINEQLGELPREDAYSFHIRPVTDAQALQWAGVQPMSGTIAVKSQMYVVTASKRNGDASIPITAFQNPLTYTFYYTDDDIVGIDERTLSVYSWDVESGTIRKEQSVLNGEKNTIASSIDHLTILFLAGDPAPTKDVSVIVVPSLTLQRAETKITGGDFGISGEGSSDFVIRGNEVFLAAGSKQELCIPAKKIAKPLKRMNMELGAVQVAFSFNESKGCYQGVLTVPQEGGKKTLLMRLAYIDDQVQIIRYRATIASDVQVRVISLVTPTAEQARIIVQEVGSLIQETVQTSQPALRTTAFAAGPVITALNPSMITQTFNWYHYLNHFISALLSALGLRKRRKPWGVVYDAINKNPIDLAIVRLFDAVTDRLIETQVTDKMGRFSFLMNPGTYRLTVIKQPFTFPSTVVKGKIDAEYSHVYHDEHIVIGADSESLDISIPLDPPSSVPHGHVFNFRSIFERFSQISLVGSLLLSIVLTSSAPNSLNIFLLFLNSMFMLAQVFFMKKTEKPWGVVYDANSGAPIPLAAIIMFNAQEKKLLRTRLTDYAGRFSFLAPAGTYILSVAKNGYAFPATVVPHTARRHQYFGGPLIVKKNKGYLRLNVPMQLKDQSQAVLPPVLDSQVLARKRASLNRDAQKV